VDSVTTKKDEKSLDAVTLFPCTLVFLL